MPQPSRLSKQYTVEDDDAQEDFTEALRAQDAAYESQDENDDDDDFEDWKTTLRPEPKRARTSTRKAAAKSGYFQEDDDVIEISSD